MRILFICSSGFDYAQDLAYAGLVNILGQGNVTDYPWNARYHLPIKSYPKNLGFTSVSFSLPLSVRFSAFDLIILGSAKPDALRVYSKILRRTKNRPVLFIDSGDRTGIGGDFYRLNAGNDYEAVIKEKPFDIILKREYIPSLHEEIKTCFPFPFSFPYNVRIPARPENAKKYEVSFWGQQIPEIRENALKILQGKYDCSQNGTTLNQNFGTYRRRGLFYLEELAACKIVLNFRGGGWDTMRYWEVPATGSFMISQKPQISIPDNFEDGKHLAWCSDSLGDLTDKIDYYLKHTDEREAMAAQAKAHLNKYHLNTARAQRLLDIVKKELLL